MEQTDGQKYQESFTDDHKTKMFVNLKILANERIKFWQLLSTSVFTMEK